MFQRPDADRLRGPGVDQNHLVLPGGRDEQFFTRRDREVQRSGEDAPVFVAVRLRFGPDERPGQEQVAAHAREAQPVLRPEQAQE